MGKFKDVGDSALALAEECAEVIQCINKKFRFNGDWNEIPEGKNQSRLQELESEMEDVIYQFRRLMKSIDRNNRITFALEIGEEKIEELNRDWEESCREMEREQMERQYYDPFQELPDY